jgi:hypothetical protein
MERKFLKKLNFSQIILIFLVTIFIIMAIFDSVLYLQKKKKSQMPSPQIQPPTLQPQVPQKVPEAVSPSIPQGPTEEPLPSSSTPPFSTLPSKIILTKSLINPEEVALEKIDVTPKISPYPLPLDLKSIANFQEFSKKIQLSSQALSLLKNNGFVVIPTPKDIGETKMSWYSLSSQLREGYPKEDFVAYYLAIREKNLPIFITSDSLLHYYHIFFDTALMRLEKDLLFDDIWQISKEFLEDAILLYQNSSGDLKEATKRNVAYFSVALELLKPKIDQIATKENIEKEFTCGEVDSKECEEIVSEQLTQGKFFSLFNTEEAKKYSFEVPDFVKDLVKEEIELIEKHQGWAPSPIFIYQEDYSQYIPRGHYTKSEKLKNYFKAMMWYGRMTALIKGSPSLPRGESKCIGSIDGLISEYDAKIQTLQACLIARKFSQSKEIQGRWSRIYAITSFFVGFSDDLGPYEYSPVLKSLFEGEIKPQDLEKKYSQIKDALMNLSYSPKIYGGLGNCKLLVPCPPLSEGQIQELKTQTKQILEATKGFKLMGQRFTLDSWLFSEIVSPYSGEYTGPKAPLPTDEKPFTFTWDDPYPPEKENRPFSWVKTDVENCPPPAEREVRGFPRGLDIMALLNSKRAREILKELGDTEYSDYESKFSELKKAIDSLPLSSWFQNLYWNWLYVLKALLNEFGQGYQTFIQTKAWQDKELTTALASWTELRHDTLLYVKQSYTMAETGGGGEELPIVGYVEPIPEFYARLLTLTKMTKKGLEKLIPQEELSRLGIGEALDEFSEIITKLLEISKKELENVPLTNEEYNFIEGFGIFSERLLQAMFQEKGTQGEFDPDIFKTTLMADVHTDGNTKKVLEEGVGYIKTLIVAYKLPQGHILVGVGPVFSYYEFKQPMEKRLTDESWQELLKNNPPPEPEWVKNFSE